MGVLLGMDSVPRSGGYIPALDGLRACAAMFVVLHHTWLQSWPYTLYSTEVPHGVWKSATHWLAYGHVAVTVFIAISGFCLMLPIVKKKGTLVGGYALFVKRRAYRILPPYYAALSLSLIVCLTVIHPNSHTIFDSSLPVSLNGIWSHLLLVQNFSANEYQINGPLWSIAVEFQIYLLFPLLVVMRNKIGMWSVLLSTFVVGFGLCRVFAFTGLGDRSTHFLFVFALGMWAAHLSSVLQGRTCAAGFARASAIGMPLFALIGLWGHRFGKDFTDFFVGLTSCCLLLFITLRKQSYISRFLSLKPLVAIGTFSYSLYLIHFPALQLFWQAFPAKLAMTKAEAFVTDCTVGLAWMTLLAWVFYYLFERPFTRIANVKRSSAAAVMPSTADFRAQQT